MITAIIWIAVILAATIGCAIWLRRTDDRE